jgi:uncharacterized protein (DUF362 family)
MKEQIVALLKNVEENIYEKIEKAMKLCKAEKIIDLKNKIVIKPNYVIVEKEPYIHVTDPRIIIALIQWLKNRGVENICIAEGGWSIETAENAFKETGLIEVSKKYNIKLINLNKDKFITIKIPSSYNLKEVNIAKTILESDCIINVSKLKVHHIAGVTLSVKNLMGCIWPKNIIHEKIQEKLADLATLIKTKINIIDGIIGSEEDEIYGNAIKMNVIIAGLNVIATDSVGCLLMGINPEKVEYLKLLEKKGLGMAKKEAIRIHGENIDRIFKNFKLPEKFMNWYLNGGIKNEMQSMWKRGNPSI